MPANLHQYIHPSIHPVTLYLISFQHVLTNEQLLEMFKGVLESDQQDTSEPSGSKKIDVAAAGFDYLPKMTRSRVREFLEKISVSIVMTCQVINTISSVQNV